MQNSPAVPKSDIQKDSTAAVPAGGNAGNEVTGRHGAAGNDFVINMWEPSSEPE